MSLEILVTGERKIIATELVKVCQIFIGASTAHMDIWQTLQEFQ